MAAVSSQIEKIVTEFRHLLDDPTSNPVLLAVAIVILSTVLILALYLINSRSAKKQGILLMGLCDSGKTLLYSLLINRRKVMTQTSIRENHGKYEFKRGKTMKQANVVDLPGHERIRGQYLKKYEDTARGIIFMVDSSTFPRQFRDIAEYMYDIFTNKKLMKSKPAMLIVCNKQDLATAKSCNVIRSQLEKEIDAMRRTRAAALKETDDVNSSKHMDIGKKGKAFEFNHVPSKIEFMEYELQNADSANIAQWIENVID